MVTALGLSITLVPGIATADEHVIERSGSLSDGTPYLISIPSD